MKKLLSLLLALMMFTVPVFGLAEDGPTVTFTAAKPVEMTKAATLAQDALDAGRRIESTLTLIPSFEAIPEFQSLDEQVATLINDLVKAIGITSSQQGDEMGFAFKLSGTDVLTLDYAASGEDYYVGSNLLGGTIVLAEDELLPLVERLVDMFAMMGLFEQEQADEIKAQLPEAFEMIKAEMASSVSAELTAEDLANMDISMVVDALKPIQEAATAAEVTAQPKNSDAAATVLTVTVTPDQMKNFIKAVFEFIKANPAALEQMEAQMAPQYAAYEVIGAEVPEVSELVDEIIATIDEETLFTRDIVVEIYLDEEDLPVLANTTLYVAGGTITSEDGETQTTEELAMEVSYVRLTNSAGITHTVNLIVEEVSMTLGVIEVENGVQVDVDVADPESEVTLHIGVDIMENLTDTAYNADIVLEMIGEEAGETMMNMGFAADADYIRNGVDYEGTANLTFNWNGATVITAAAAIKTTDPAPSIMTGDVVRPAELSDTDFATWFVGIINNLQTWLMGTVLPALPPSVLTLMMAN